MKGISDQLMRRGVVPRKFTVFLALASCLSLSPAVQAQDSEPPHAVFVVGTPHYNPAATMPPLASRLQNLGFRCTVVEPEWDPERNPDGIPGLEVLREADVAIFYLRFLTLPESQFREIRNYLESGRPVVGLRTSTHAFAYPEGHPLQAWNDDFGRRALGSKYFIHGKGTTRVQAPAGHEILTGYDFTTPRPLAGTLYLSDIPEDATVLLTGTGAFKKTGTVTNAFGTHELQAEMTDDVAWTWTNEWGGRVFTTTLGGTHTFRDAHFVRFLLNGIHWAAGQPVPDPALPAEPIQVNPGNQKPVAKAPAKLKSRPSAGNRKGE